ncbi:MAG: hypothetical protein J0L75_16230, partial [Spirochaetes bacterium]|nr:hypothetical protein [Spirochaetota bacterium]
MESFKAYYYSRYQKGGGLPGQKPAAPAAFLARAPQPVRPRKAGSLARFWSGFFSKLPAKPRHPDSLLHKALGSAPSPRR